MLKQNMQNQTISKVYTDDKKENYLATVMIFLSQQKNFFEKLYTKEITSKTVTTKCVSLTNQTNVSLTNLQVMTAEFYKQFSNELSFKMFMNCETCCAP